MFAAIWIYLRHYLNWCILWAVLTEFRTVGPFDLDWATEQYKCWISQIICFALLASLQAVNLFWLYFIFKIARNYLFAKTWADERSEGEADEADEADESDRIDDGAVDAKAANGERTEMNGRPVLHDAPRREGESYAEAVKEGTDMEDEKEKKKKKQSETKKAL